MPSGAVPFAVALGLILATMVTSIPTLNRLDKSIDSLKITSEKGQLKRAAEWYSDLSQSLGVLVPAVVGLSVGTAKGSGVLLAVYIIVISLTFFALIAFGITNPLDYGGRLPDPLTPMLLLALVVNAAALIVSWAAVGTIHSSASH
jgi:hypothetical protein